VARGREGEAAGREQHIRRARADREGEAAQRPELAEPAAREEREQ